MNEGKVFPGVNGQNQGNGVALNWAGTSANGLSKGQVNWAYENDTTISDSDSDTGCHGDNSMTDVSHDSVEEKRKTCGSDTHSIILDISTTSFVDTVTMKTLKNVCLCQQLIKSSVLDK